MNGEGHHLFLVLVEKIADPVAIQFERRCMNPLREVNPEERKHQSQTIVVKQKINGLHPRSEMDLP